MLFMPFTNSKSTDCAFGINSGSPTHTIKESSWPITPTKFWEGNSCGKYLGRKLTFMGTQSLDYSWKITSHFIIQQILTNTEQLANRIKR